MSGQPQLEMLMPVYNSARFLREALESVGTQLRPTERLIVQDGGSTDGTLAILDQYSRFTDVASGSDGGQADALNRALSRTAAEWVGWLNADDTLEPGALERVRPHLDHKGSVIVFGDYSLKDAAGATRAVKRLRPLTLADIEIGLLIPFSGSFFIRTEYLRALGGFDPSYRYCMDYHLYLRAWSSLGSRYASYVPGVCGALRIYEGTKTNTSPWGFVREAARARADSPSYPGRLRSLVATSLHVILVATTPLRASHAYRRVRTAGGPS